MGSYIGTVSMLLSPYYGLVDYYTGITDNIYLFMKVGTACGLSDVYLVGITNGTSSMTGTYVIPSGGCPNFDYTGFGYYWNGRRK